jgi:hypothetical protein
VDAKKRVGIADTDRVDYKFTGYSERRLAGCQLKGPLRPKGARELDNHFGVILEDIAKQRREAVKRPDVEHYVAILLCLDRAPAEDAMRGIWMPALEAETTASIAIEAMNSTSLLNKQKASVCIIRVSPRTNYPCGCAVV